MRMPSILAALLAFLLVAPALAAPLAPTPPMGWNSWDAYGFTIDEAHFRANAEILAGLRSFGWTYAVVDEGWYMANPLGDKLATRAYLYDGYGRLMPVESRFPSAAGGVGLKGLADWTHAQGLKFGIHIVRGIPKAAVEANLPIAGSSFHAADAADRASICPWDDANYGIADNQAGQAWYDSLLKQYAAWGVDFLKVDCIADHPYRPSEISQIARAIAKSGRRIVLSLSPGPAPLAHAEDFAREAQMWRIADDLWDSWTFPHPDPSTTFPNGILSTFDNLAKWNPWVRPGRWPDADMLPFGSLKPHPGWGEPRQSRLTENEMRTAFTLFAIARSPLILGGDLTALEAAERTLLVNRDIIALNQRGGTSRPVTGLPTALAAARVWISTTTGAARPDTIAVFNTGDTPLDVQAAWSELGLPARSWAVRDLWTGENIAASEHARFAVPAHGVTVYRLR